MDDGKASWRKPLIVLGATGMAVSVVLALDLDGRLLRIPPLKELGLAVASFAVLATGLSIPRPRPPEGAPTPPQLAGETCAGCQQKIVMDAEGTRCAICREPVHEDCRADHEQLGHRETGPSAYR